MRDIMGLMKQVQSAQAKLQEMQAEMETVEVEGEAGGGLVKIRLNAKGTMKGVSIDPSLLKPKKVKSSRICSLPPMPKHARKPKPCSPRR